MSDHLGGVVSYATDRAETLAALFERFAQLNAYQLVGHRANLEDWLCEAEGVIAFLDGYGARFQKMKRAQVAWVEAHDVRESRPCRFCGGPCEFGPTRPNPPLRVPSSQIDEARRLLREGARKFLLQLYRRGMLDREQVVEAAARLGTGFEAKELRLPEPDLEPGVDPDS